MNITWENLQIKAAETTIVHNSSGFCQAGTVLAIMGSSGCGKTTLLSALAGQRLNKVTQTGTIYANGKPYSTSNQFCQFGSFVRQNDILFQNLTVRQTIFYSALLKAGNRQQAQQLTDQLVQKFELRKCENSKIGGRLLMKAISGGEKKRLCIALETLNNSKVLILDEPTSGLDSDKALKVVKVLKKLAIEEKTTVILSIHQPSYNIFEKMDRFLVLRKGQTVFQAERKEMSTYLNQLEVEYSLKSTLSDSFLLEISDYKANTLSYVTPVNHSNYLKYQAQSVNKDIYKINQTVYDDSILEGRKKVKKGTGEQFRHLLQREKKLFLRSPLRFGRVIFNALISFILIGFVFWNKIAENRPQEGKVYFIKEIIQFYFIEAQSCIFLNSTTVIASRLFTTALGIPGQIQVYSKQSISKTYSPLSYFLVKIIIQLPPLLAGTLFYSCGGYWLQGFSQTTQQFLMFCLVMCTLAVLGNSMGMLVGMIFLDQSKISIMLPISFVPLMLLSGIFNKLNDITILIRWMQYISPYRYGVHMLLENEYGNEVYAYELEGVGVSTYDYRQDLGISLSLWENIGVCYAISGAFYIISYILLRGVNKRLSIV